MGPILLEGVWPPIGDSIHPVLHHGLHHVEVDLLGHLFRHCEEVGRVDIPLQADDSWGHDGSWIRAGHDGRDFVRIPTDPPVIPLVVNLVYGEDLPVGEKLNLSTGGHHRRQNLCAPLGRESLLLLGEQVLLDPDPGLEPQVLIDSPGGGWRAHISVLGEDRNGGLATGLDGESQPGT